MGQRLRMIDTNPGLLWLLITLGLMSFIMLVILLVASLTYRPPVNPDTLKYFSNDFLLQAARYNKLNLILSVSAKILVWMFMAFIVWIWWRFFSENGHVRIYTAAGYIVLFYIILNIIILPLSFYQGYILEHKFGLSNQTVAMWFSDLARAKAIDILISVVAFTGIYALMAYVPRFWWLIAASVMAVFIILGAYLYPVLIDPLFFKFNRLDDGRLKQDIFEVTEKAGIKINDVMVADASRKTVKANAYFTGFGNTRRIVLYDNLLDNFDREEILNVVAHESAHWKYDHILKNIVVGIAAGLLGFFVLNILSIRTGLKGDFRIIFVTIILISFITFLTVPVQNLLSRYFERQADELALEITGEYDAQIELMEDLARANLSNVDPDPVIRVILYSHPTIMERINSAERLRDSARDL